LMKKNACFSCHSTNGKRVVGPTFLNIYGRTETVISESGEEKQIKVDREYIIRSLDQPNAEVVKSYGKGMMQSYKDVFSRKEKEMIVEYLKSLRDSE